MQKKEILAALEQKPKLQNKVTYAAAHFHFWEIRGQGRHQMSCNTAHLRKPHTVNLLKIQGIFIVVSAVCFIHKSPLG